MSLFQPRRPMLDALRDTLRKMEADPGPETPDLADLKRIILQRISELESTQRLILPLDNLSKRPSGGMTITS
jgi:hypothetical protein